MSDQQLDLFDQPEPTSELSAHELEELPNFESDRQLTDRLPKHVLFGSSSWTFPGWRGLIYPSDLTEKELVRRGLAIYARHPLFRTVGIDRSFYRPLDRETLRRYRAQLPPNSRVCSKPGERSPV